MELKTNSDKYKDILIAHACGSHNGLIYTNSLEAFIENYKAGYRRFEIDLLLSKEEDLISFHNPLGYNFVSSEKFGSLSMKYLMTCISDFTFMVNNPVFTLSEKKIIDSYLKRQLTPIKIADLAKICKEYPDVEFILDTKYTDYNLYMKQFNIIRKVFEENEIDLKQLTPQFYNIEMAKEVLKEFSFVNNIYTLYMQPFNVEKILNEIEQNKDIKGITVSKNRLLNYKLLIKKLHELGKKCNVHTIANADEIDDYLDMNVDGIYTFIEPKDLIIQKTK